MFRFDNPTGCTCFQPWNSILPHHCPVHHRPSANTVITTSASITIQPWCCKGRHCAHRAECYGYLVNN